MFSPQYEAQTELLIHCIPEVSKHPCFALKGGTAINLFLRDMPRVSVDIDLTYLPLKPRDESLREIEQTLLRMKLDIERNVTGTHVNERRIQGIVAKLSVVRGDTEIKIEPNLVLRGSVGEPALKELCSAAQQHFRASARMVTLALEDVYGGKLCAALDRQHPRDLFDIHQLLTHEGITPAIRRAFTVYLASHTRPMHELLNPNLTDITDAYDRQFTGMVREHAVLDKLLESRRELVAQLAPSLDVNERQFLLSMKSGEPDWAVLGIEGLERMPALQWKLLNIRKMDARKRDEQLEVLKDLLGM
jgi:predicted nucleotidyltransferase component of viral defense system